jgi:curli biogenesis system outer membrane secretion channel CsgG
MFKTTRNPKVTLHLYPFIACVMFASGCGTPTVDRSAAQAKAETPEAAKVEAISLPPEPGLPTFVVAILPFDESASGVTSGGGATPTAPSALGTPVGIFTGGLEGGGVNTSFPQAPASVGPIGKGIAAQLRTALARWGNISIVDPAALTRQQDGTYTCKMNDRELGPFIISGTVTEFNETADMTQKKKGGSLGGVGALVGIGGALAGSPGAAYTGTGIAAANPTFQNEKMKRTGTVGMDLQVMDGRSARVVGAFNCSGRFTSVSAVSGASLFGIGGGGADFAASALGQATRAAMNDALKQTADVLRRASAAR